MKPLLFIALLAAVLLAAFAWYLHDDRARIQLRSDSLTAITDSLAGEAARLRVGNQALATSIDSQVAAVARQKEEELQRVKATYDELEKSMQAEIAQGQVQITRLADRLQVSMVDKILFPSGEATITAAGLRVLARVGEILKGAQDKTIRVEGHTDNVAISPALRKQFPTNWELSTTRATNVVRFLQDSVGIEPARL